MRVRRTVVAATALTLMATGGLSGCGSGGAEEPVAGEGGGGGDVGEATEAPADDPTTMADVQVPTGPFTDAAGLADALNGVCADVNDVYAQSSVYGMWPAGIALEYGALAEGRATMLEKYRTVEPPAESADTYASYLDALEARNEAIQAVADANESGDQAAIDAAWEEDTTTYDAVAEVRDELGLDVCSAPVAPTVEDTGSEPDPDAVFVEPDRGVDEVAADLVDAFATSDCGTANSLQFAVMTDEQCRAEKPFYSGAEIVGTAQFGPVGVATLDAGEDQWPADLYFVVDDEGGLRMAGILRSAVGSLHPANEGNTSDEVAQRWVDAVRDDDADAFNETLSVDRSPEDDGWTRTGSFDSFGTDDEGSTALVSDVRSDPDATLQRLGVTRGYGFYLLTAGGNQYEVGTTLQPGSRTEYRVTSFWELPEPA